MNFEQLKLENQLCFPLYALSRLVTHEYQPYFDKLGITYPQYLVLLVLWEQEKGLTVNEISKKLILNTNTVTPLLKHMEQMGLISRTRSLSDERKVQITLTDKGKELRIQVSEIPMKLASKLLQGPISQTELYTLKNHLCELIEYLTPQGRPNSTI